MFGIEISRDKLGIVCPNSFRPVQNIALQCFPKTHLQLFTNPLHNMPVFVFVVLLCCVVVVWLCSCGCGVVFLWLSGCKSAG